MNKYLPLGLIVIVGLMWVLVHSIESKVEYIESTYSEAK